MYYPEHKLSIIFKNQYVIND